MPTTEWFEFFLTQNGWEKGSEKLAFGKSPNVETPNDAIIKVTFKERDNGYSATDCWCEVEVIDKEQIDLVDSLLQQYGNVPSGHESQLNDFNEQLENAKKKYLKIN